MSKQVVKVGDTIYVRGVGEVTVNEILPDGCPVYEDDAGANVYVEYGDYEIITNEEDDNMTKEKAQVGDLIRIVDSEDAPKGAIFEVVKAYDDLGEWITYVDGTFDDGDQLFFYEDEYVIHRKAGEEDSDTCGKCASFAGTDNEGSFCSRECIERMQRNHVPAQSDAVNHPNHYTQGKFETIEVIEQFTSGYDDGFTAHCIGTATKYIARAPFKHDTPLEDLKKAARYIAYAIEHEQRKIDA